MIFLKPRTNIVGRHKKSDVLTENLLFYCQIDRLFVSADNICTRLYTIPDSKWPPTAFVDIFHRFIREFLIFCVFLIF
jgi:hypothetical protein